MLHPIIATHTQTYLVVCFEIVIEHIDTDGEISSVVGIGPVPSLRSKLSPLYHHGMEVDQREQDTLELILLRAHLEGILNETKIFKISSTLLLLKLQQSY